MDFATRWSGLLVSRAELETLCYFGAMNEIHEYVHISREMGDSYG